MKKTTSKVAFFAFCLLMTCTNIVAQNQIIKNEKFEFYRKDVLFGLGNTWKGTRSFYYDKNDNKILHGKTTINDKFHENNGRATVDEVFRVEANYKDGKSDGIMKIYFKNTIISQGNTINCIVESNTSHKEGVADGEWRASLSITGMGYSGKNTYFGIFKHGVLSKCVINYNFNGSTTKIADFSQKDGLITGSFIPASKYSDKKEIKVFNSIVINSFVRLTGEESETEEKEKAIIRSTSDSIISNKRIPSQWLLSQGYILEKKTTALPDLNFLRFLYDTIILDHWEKFEKNENKTWGNDTIYVLQKVRTISYKELIDWCNSFEKTDYYKYYTPYSYESYDLPNKNQLNTHRYFFLKKYFSNSKRNYIHKEFIYDRNCYSYYYFTEDVRHKILEYINPLAEAESKAIKEAEQLIISANIDSIYKIMEKSLSKWTLGGKKFRDIKITDYKTINNTDIDFISAKVNYSNNNSWGYSTYQISIKGNILKNYSPDYIVKEAIEKSIKIDNCWDTINRLSDSIKNTDIWLKAQLLDKTFKDASSDYSAFSKEIIWTSIISDSPKVTLKKVEGIYSTQKIYKSFINLKKQILSNHEIITSTSGCKNIKNIYKDYYKNIDMSWENNNVQKDFIEVINTQNAILNIIKNPNVEEINKQIKKDGCKSISCLLKYQL